MVLASLEYNTSYVLFIHQSWTNLSWQDEPLAEFSTLEVAACHAMHLLHSIAIWSKLELKNQPKQLLGSLLLDIALRASVYKRVSKLGCFEQIS